MTRELALALTLACVGMSAHAQDIGGTYTVSGTNHDGSTYEGTAEITLTSDTTCEIVWETGTTSWAAVPSAD